MIFLTVVFGLIAALAVLSQMDGESVFWILVLCVMASCSVINHDIDSKDCTKIEKKGVPS